MNNKFGKILKELRKENGLKQADLGKVMNLAYNTISSWERGNSCPNIDELIILADYFSVSIDYLVGRRDY